MNILTYAQKFEKELLLKNYYKNNLNMKQKQDLEAFLRNVNFTEKQKAEKIITYFKFYRKVQNFYWGCFVMLLFAIFIGYKSQQPPPQTYCNQYTNQAIEDAKDFERFEEVKKQVIKTVRTIRGNVIDKSALLIVLDELHLEKIK